MVKKEEGKKEERGRGEEKMNVCEDIHIYKLLTLTFLLSFYVCVGVHS